MKLNYTFSILYWLYKGKAKNGLAPIYARITVDGKRTEVSTKKWVNPSEWDKIAQGVKGKGEQAREINRYLNLLRAEIEEIHLRITSNDRIPTPEEIKSQLLGSGNDPKTEPEPEIISKTILEAFDYHNLKMEEKITKAKKGSLKTLKRYEITKNKVLNFMKFKYGVDDRPLPELRLSFATEFEHYLLTHDGMHSNTAHKYIKNLKKIMKMAVGLDWIPSSPIDLFKCVYIDPEREFLTQDELQAIMDKQIDIPRLEEVRDVFVFCCYTRS